MIELKHKENTLQCELSEYDYAHGIGVTAIFHNEGSPIGKIKFLCDKSDEQYPQVSKYTYEDIATKLEKALASNVYEELLNNMYLWQSEIEKLGHNTLSPLYGRIANAF